MSTARIFGITVNINTILLVGVLAVLVFKFRLSNQIDAHVIRVEERAKHTEEMLVKFMELNFNRWEEFERGNPGITVPQAPRHIVVPTPTP